MGADRPGVMAPPPLIFALSIGLGFLMNWVFPIPFVPINPVVRNAIGFGFVLLAVFVAGWGLSALHRAGTPVDPNRPTMAIVETGPYRYTRNPLYLSMVMVQIGLGLIFSTSWLWIMLVPVIIVMTKGVIMREERYLQSKFGDPYRDYKHRVRRWL